MTNSLTAAFSGSGNIHRLDLRRERIRERLRDIHRRDVPRDRRRASVCWSGTGSCVPHVLRRPRASTTSDPQPGVSSSRAASSRWAGRALDDPQLGRGGGGELLGRHDARSHTPRDVVSLYLNPLRGEPPPPPWPTASVDCRSNSKRVLIGARRSGCRSWSSTRAEPLGGRCPSARQRAVAGACRGCCSSRSWSCTPPPR